MAVKPPKPKPKPSIPGDLPGDLPGVKPGGKPGDLPRVKPEGKPGDLPGVKPGGKPGGKPPPSPKQKAVEDLKGKSEADIKKSVEGKTLKGQPIDKVAADPKVIDAAKQYKDMLYKIGIGTGALVAGLAALMIIYDETNPIEAIKKAAKDAGETFEDATNLYGNFFKDIGDKIKKFGIFIVVGIFILIILSFVVPMIIKMLFKKTLTQAPPPPPPPPPPPLPYNQTLYAVPPKA